MNLFLKIKALILKYDNADTRAINYQGFNSELLRIVIDYIIAKG